MPDRNVQASARDEFGAITFEYPKPFKPFERHRGSLSQFAREL